jgi:hypothetical protein
MEYLAMTMPNLTTARFVLQCLLEELEEYDRCIPVARNIQVGDVADALMTVLGNRELQRLAMPKKTRAAPSRRPVRRPALTVAAKQQAARALPAKQKPHVAR